MVNNERRYQPIEELDVFLIFEKLADEIWDRSLKFHWFAKATIGRQIVRAADSVGANLVEGDGRGSDPDAIRFFYIARGSARELRYWINRCERRRLIQQAEAKAFIDEVHRGALLLNQLIKFRRESGSVSRVKEARRPFPAVTEDPFMEPLD